MSKFWIYIFLLISFSVKPSFASVSYFENGVAKVSMAFGVSDSVSVSVETIDTPHDFAFSKAYTWGGDETSPPKKIIKTISVLKNGQILFIPLSAYADLGNPKEISVKKLPGNGFQLIVGGGDAAGSYRAILNFKKNEISYRKVISGEFPKEVWEETTFAFNHLNN